MSLYVPFMNFKCPSRMLQSLLSAPCRIWTWWWWVTTTGFRRCSYANQDSKRSRHSWDGKLDAVPCPSPLQHPKIQDPYTVEIRYSVLFFNKATIFFSRIHPYPDAKPLLVFDPFTKPTSSSSRPLPDTICLKQLSNRLFFANATSAGNLVIKTY